MWNQDKRFNYVVGGLAIASIALLAYTVTRPTKERKSKNKRKRKKDKSKKMSKKFSKKPIGVHLVMESMDGFNAHIAGDKKNQKLQLKYGSRLLKINDKKVENLSYQEIFEILQRTKVPITLQFRELPDLCSKWTRAEQFKDEANGDYKNGKTDSAIEKVSKGIELHPTNKMYYSNRILMFLSNAQYQKALQDCQTIRELDPKSMYIKGHYLRGLTLLNLKKYKNAASAFQTVVKLNPSFKKATDRLNECLREIEKSESEEQKEMDRKQRELQTMYEEKSEKKEEPKIEKKEISGKKVEVSKDKNAEVSEDKSEVSKDKKAEVSEDKSEKKEENVSVSEPIQNESVPDEAEVKEESVPKTEEIVEPKEDSAKDEVPKDNHEVPKDNSKVKKEEAVKNEISIAKDEKPKDEIPKDKAPIQQGSNGD